MKKTFKMVKKQGVFMKIRHGVGIVLSGVIWMGAGFFLMLKGFSLLLHPQLGKEAFLIPKMGSLAGSLEQASLALVCLGLVIGFIKGRVVLSKTATRVITRILSLPNPLPISSLYPLSYILLLSSMILLGVSLRWVSLPYDVKGVVDVAIGSALINGSAFYFRYFIDKKQKI